ncbi:hypothetical protein DSECCO2_469360 [anaerobic digester metagenome]
MKTKKLLLAVSMLLFVIVISSCSSKEKKAEKLIKQDLFESLFDYSSYEPIKTDKLDSAFTSIYTDSIIQLNSTLFKVVFDKSQDLKEEIDEGLSNMRLWSDSYSSYGRSKFIDAKNDTESKIEEFGIYSGKADSLREIVKSHIKSFNPKFIGYKTIHKFRSKNRGGNFGLSSVEYVFDPKINSIIRQEIINDDTDGDDITIKEIIEILNESVIGKDSTGTRN